MAFRLVERKPLIPKNEDTQSLTRICSDVSATLPVRQRARPRKVKAAYPGKIAIRHAGEAARSLGIDICGIEVSPDGTIRVLDRKANPTHPKDEFEQWLQGGKLA